MFQSGAQLSKHLLSRSKSAEEVRQVRELINKDYIEENQVGDTMMIIHFCL